MRTQPSHAAFLITSDPTMTQPAEDLPLASEAEHFALDFPYQKSVKVRRDLKHFELWLQDVYKSTIDGPIPLAYIYKDFFLSHITLYPNAMMPGRLLPADLERELLRSGWWRTQLPASSLDGSVGYSLATPPIQNNRYPQANARADPFLPAAQEDDAQS